MNKKVLIMCTGNSCRSIIAEALVNTHLKGVDAYSCGVKPSGKVNPNAQKVLEANSEWDEKYYSKHLEVLSDITFDLVVTVCDSAKESCPIFPKATPTIHIGFDDPDGKNYESFEITHQKIKERLLTEVKKRLIILNK